MGRLVLAVLWLLAAVPARAYLVPVVVDGGDEGAQPAKIKAKTLPEAEQKPAHGRRNGKWRHGDYVHNFGHKDLPHNYVLADAPVFYLPPGFVTVLAQGGVYYYNEGVFYQQADDQLMQVPPPVGAVVRTIPTDRQTVTIDGKDVQSSKGVFYRSARGGYEVIPPPANAAGTGSAAN